MPVDGGRRAGGGSAVEEDVERGLLVRRCGGRPRCPTEHARCGFSLTPGIKEEDVIQMAQALRELQGERGCVRPRVRTWKYLTANTRGAHATPLDHWKLISQRLFERGGLMTGASTKNIARATRLSTTPAWQ